jgi:nucleoside-diphosphate-sugar epimerase
LICALTGATGYVGRFIVRRLAAEGVAIRAWRRASSDLAGLPRTIEWIEGALGDEDSAKALVAGADMLVHAALEHLPGRYRGGEGADPARFWQLNVDGSAMLLRAARDAGVGRAVALSSRAVFGRAAKGFLADAAKPSPDTHYGAAKKELETFIKKFSDGWPVAALRPTGVYGIVQPVERSKWFTLVADAIDGRAVAARAATEVHGDDVARATWILLQAKPEAVAGRALNCSDIIVSHREIVTLVHAIAGVSGPLPEEGDAPPALLQTDALTALGMKFGGRARLEETVRELVSAVQGNPTTSTRAVNS